MNSEELEKSLRTEFENHLKSVLAGMRQELDGFQEKFTSEIENHKARLGDVLQEFSTRLDADKVNSTQVLKKRLSNICGWRVTKARELRRKRSPKPKNSKKNPLLPLVLTNCAMRSATSAVRVRKPKS